MRGEMRPSAVNYRTAWRIFGLGQVHLNNKILIVLAVIVVVVLAAFALRRSSSLNPSGNNPANSASADSKNKTDGGTSGADQVSATDKGFAPSNKTTKSQVDQIDPKTGKLKGTPGAVPLPQPQPVKAETNPQVRSVAEALRDKNHPERLSPIIPPKPFDAEAYKQNPRAYLDVVEPGRAMQSAQPGKDVRRIQALTPQLQDVKPGGSVTLKVRAVPKMPVSLTSTDLGAFDNKLTAITVEADETGVAEVKFFATPGTEHGVRIMAASPVTSGTLNFQVNVLNPR